MSDNKNNKNSKKKNLSEKPIPDAYGIIDNDVARDNLENDLTAADIQDI